MIGWRNKNTGVVHAHSSMGPGGRSGYTLCGRAQLWTGSRDLRLDFEMVEPTPDMPRCSYCVTRLHAQLESLTEWLGEVAP